MTQGQILECPECGERIIVYMQDDSMIPNKYQVYDAWKAKWAQKQTCPVCRARMEYFKKMMVKA
jgi:rubrerythrin